MVFLYFELLLHWNSKNLNVKNLYPVRTQRLFQGLYNAYDVVLTLKWRRLRTGYVYGMTWKFRISQLDCFL